jgi:hypothetical protein
MAPEWFRETKSTQDLAERETLTFYGLKQTMREILSERAQEGTNKTMEARQMVVEEQREK